MSISTWGWGSCGIAIGTAGWGDCPCVEYVPYILLATYLGDHDAYSCAASREYIEIRTRDRGEVLLRMRPEQIPERLIEDVLTELRKRPGENWSMLDALTRSKCPS